MLSALGGLKLRSLWGAAMLTFIPLWWFLFHHHTALNPKRWTRAFITVHCLALVAVLLMFPAAPYLTGKGKRVHYPGPAIAQHIDGEWQKLLPNTPMRYAVGSVHSAALLSFYSAHRPSAFITSYATENLWIKQNEWQNSHAVVIWINARGDGSIPDFPRQHHTVTPQPSFEAAWRTAAPLPPLKINWAILTPK